MYDLLEIRTLGGLAITCGPVRGLATRKAEAVLVYLACQEHAQPRETLAELFWPDRPQAQALASMRVTLSRLRQQLAPFITATRQTIGMNPECPYWLDMAELEDQLTLVGDDLHTTASILARAVEMYHGDFLAGFFVQGCPEFEDWARHERDRLRRTIIERLWALVRHDLHHGSSYDGITHAAQLLRIDPLHEETHRHLMLLLAQTGQRAEALRQFEICRTVLAAELAIEPDVETFDLYQKIREGSTVTARPVVLPRHI